MSKWVAIAHVAGTVAANRPRGNLVDTSTWVIGSSGAQGVAGGNYFDNSQSAPSTESAITIEPDVDGVSRAVWKCTSAEGPTGSNEADGGFYTGPMPVAAGQIYRFHAFVRAADLLTGQVFLGPDENMVADIATGTPNANPYFMIVNRTQLVAFRWYLLVGFVLPSTIGTTPPSPSLGGVYDCATGQRVAGATDFKWTAGQTRVRLRLFQYYAATGAITWFSNRVGLWMVDGTEPSIDELLASTTRPLPAPDFEARYGLNGQFSRWQLGSDVAEGWTHNGGTSSREAAITRTGPNAQRSVSTGAGTAGIVKTIDFGGLPLAAGSFIEGTLDVYLINHVSGGYPALVIRCYTNSGLSSYRELVVNLPNTASGWQTLTFKAAVNDGERIYGVLFAPCSSWATATGGNGANDVVFDSLVVDAVQPSGTLHLGANAATNVYTASVVASAGWSSSE